MGGLEASVEKVLVDDVVGAQVFGLGPVLHGGSEDGIAIVDITDEDVLVAMTGGDWKSAGEVGGNRRKPYGCGHWVCRMRVTGLGGCRE